MNQQYTLSNDTVKLVLDDQANLQELSNLKTGHNYASGQGIWRMIYSRNEVIENEIHSEDCSPHIQLDPGKSLRIEYSQLEGPRGTEAFTVQLLIRLEGDAFNFSYTLENSAPNERVIREFNFPVVKDISIAKGQSLLGGAPTGDYRHVKIEDIPGTIQKHHSYYMHDEAKAIEMPWFDNGFAMFANDSDGLYLGDHNPAFETTVMLFRKRGKAIDAGIHSSPFLAPGEQVASEGLILSPFAGDWHSGAKKYRQWAEQTWYQPSARPDSLTHSFNGWYRLIMRHQYGEILHAHDELPKILQSMQETGIDTLLIFGWWKEGMDAGYPEYTFDESQGGRVALKEHFRKFRAAGGKIILYFNGRLIDTQTEFYKKRGRQLAIRGCDGEPLVERYMFEGPGITLRHQFGYKSFVMACPYADDGAWMNELKRMIDTAIDLEVDGVFFDQLGMPEQPCFDPNHGHSVPLRDSRAIRMQQLKEVREYLRQQRPEMSFGIECASNFTSPFADVFHSFPGWNAASNDWQRTGEKPQLNNFIELYRYTFPEALISDRDIREDTDIERRVNLALLRGLVSDVEVQRCRALIDETPHYKAYLTQANALRDRYRRLILNGRFMDTDGADCNNNEISWSVFTNGNELALVATQSHLEQTTAQFSLPGYTYIEDASLGQASIRPDTEGVQVQLQRHALSVVIFKQTISS